MSGIYIHIPFCKKACHYCNFHFSTNLGKLTEMVAAICKDIDLRHKFLNETKIATVYFGGGTPSLLSKLDLELILSTLRRYYTIDEDAEITMECNPDDLTMEYLFMLKQIGINRLSIGIQSFFEEDLLFMNRAHNAKEASNSILMAKAAGFENITIDLIYGSNTTTMEMWKENIDQALSFEIPHISSYCLTVEEKTVFDKWVKSKKMVRPDEEKSNLQFEYLIEKLTKAGFDHYEISNFGKPGKHAIHNTNYWKGKDYLGLGPSAHSYNGTERNWCISNNNLYISNINTGLAFVENELLSMDDKYNEYIMIGLRTMWGINLIDIKNKFGISYYENCISSLNDQWLMENLLIKDEQITLSQSGKYFADKIASMMFI
jgi:oxygen-independent coproporphyrinogen III oxidase